MILQYLPEDLSVNIGGLPLKREGKLPSVDQDGLSIELEDHLMLDLINFFYIFDMIIETLNNC